MPAGPNTAFVLTIFGLLGMYGELIWPGRRIAGLAGPGVLGLGAALTGAYFLWLHSPTTFGLQFLGAAVALFAIDAMVNSYFVAGVAGAVAMTIGFWKLFDGPRGIVAGLAFPLCLLFGSITMFLSYGAKRARRNKWKGTFRQP